MTQNTLPTPDNHTQWLLSGEYVRAVTYSHLYFDVILLNSSLVCNITWIVKGNIYSANWFSACGKIRKLSSSIYVYVSIPVHLFVYIYLLILISCSNISLSLFLVLFHVLIIIPVLTFYRMFLPPFPKPFVFPSLSKDWIWWRRCTLVFSTG